MSRSRSSNSRTEPQTIGVLGGTFDPVHNGHLAVAASALSELSLDTLIFVPNSRSPLKSSGPAAPFHHRLEMLRIAIAGCAHYEVSDIEGRRGGTSYTVDTLRELKYEQPDNLLYLIVGADALAEFHLWRNYEEILQLATLAYVGRAGESRSPSQIPARLIPMSPVDVSSTMIRERLRLGQPADSLTPLPVVQYVRAHHLYGT